MPLILLAQSFFLVVSRRIDNMDVHLKDLVMRGNDSLASNIKDMYWIRIDTRFQNVSEQKEKERDANAKIWAFTTGFLLWGALGDGQPWTRDGQRWTRDGQLMDSDEPQWYINTGVWDDPRSPESGKGGEDQMWFEGIMRKDQELVWPWEMLQKKNFSTSVPGIAGYCSLWEMQHENKTSARFNYLSAEDDLIGKRVNSLDAWPKRAGHHDLSTVLARTDYVNLTDAKGRPAADAYIFTGEAMETSHMVRDLVFAVVRNDVDIPPGLSRYKEICCDRPFQASSTCCMCVTQKERGRCDR